MKKRLIALLLAVTMVLAGTATVFAEPAEETVTAAETQVTEADETNEETVTAAGTQAAETEEAAADDISAAGETEEAEGVPSTAEQDAFEPSGEGNYLTFTAVEAPSSVKFSYSAGTDVKYSTDGGANWTSCSSGTTITLDTGESVSFKGKNVTTDYDNHFTMSGTIAASGDVTSLTNGEGGDATLANSCYSYMFYGCESLTTAPALPATTLADYCYRNMFYGCTGLTTAPALPATTLADYCYFCMFQGCTGLTTAPELPAKTLADRCYSYMFYNCTSLTTAPNLPAENLVNYCYFCMFYDCTGLTTAPKLPAKTLADGCYDSMFQGCTGLTTAPELPAKTLADGCYKYMFYGCTGLTTAPALPATTLADGCYRQMFQGCTSLTTAPNLPATTLAKECYYYMFYRCSALRVSESDGKGVAFFRCPDTSGVDNPVKGMFSETGAFTADPTAGKTYYYKSNNVSDSVVSEIFGQTYSGSAITPAVTVTLNGETLVKDQDYTVSYKDNKNVGTAKVTITGKGNYTGTKEAEFKITAKELQVNDTAVNGKTYDGTTDAVVGRLGTLTGAVSGDDVSIDTSVAAFDTEDAGVSKKVTVKYTLKGTAAGNYTVKDSEAFADITKAKQSVPKAESGLVYNGGEQTGVKASETAKYTLSGNEATDAGNYSATAVLIDKNNYEWDLSTPTTDNQNIPWVISKAGQSAPAGLAATAPSVKGGNDGKISGTSDKMEYKSASASEYIPVSGTEITGLSAGTYKVRYKEDNNHAAGQDAEVTVTDGKAVPAASDFTFTAPSSLTYDGTAKKATVTGKDGMGTITVKYFDKDEKQLTSAPVDAGTYTVKIDVAEGTAYKEGSGLTAADWTFTITQAPVTVTAKDASKLYGEDDPAAFTADVKGTLGTDKVAYTVKRAEGKDAGTYAITPAGDASQGNYYVTYVPGTFTIHKMTLEVAGSTVKDKIYDATTDADVTAGQFNLDDPDLAFVLEDDVHIDKAVGKFEDANAGTDKGVIISYTLKGTDASNYEIMDSKVFADITQAPVTVTAKDASKEYGAKDPALTAEVKGTLGTDTVKYTVSRTKGEDAGAYTITPAGDASQGNYKVTYVSGTFTVNPAKDTPVKTDTDALAKIQKEYQEKNPGSEVKVEMQVSEKAAADDVKKIQEKAGTKKLVSFDASLVVKVDEKTVADAGSSNKTLVSTTYKFDFANKSEIQAFRVHEGSVDELTTNPNADGEYVKLDKTAGTITVVACKYSTYAFAYKESAVPVTGDSGNAWLYIIIAVIALGAAAGAGIAMRRRAHR